MYLAYRQVRAASTGPRAPASAYMAGWGLVPVTWEAGRAYTTMGVFWVTTLINGIMSFLGEF